MYIYETEISNYLAVMIIIYSILFHYLLWLLSNGKAGGMLSDNHW